MLQKHMMSVRPDETGMKTKADSKDLKTYGKVVNVDTKTADVQIKKMMPRYVLVDNERC